MIVFTAEAEHCLEPVLTAEQKEAKVSKLKSRFTERQRHQGTGAKPAPHPQWEPTGFPGSWGSPRLRPCFS